MTVSLTTLPLPQDLALAASASALNDAGYWASLYDASWRLVFVTDELRLTFGDIGTSSSWPIGHHYFSVEMVRFRETRLQGAWASPNFRRKNFLLLGPYVLATTRGGHDELRRAVDPEFSDLVDQLNPVDLPAMSTPEVSDRSESFAGEPVTTVATLVRIEDGLGHLAGVALLTKPAAGMSHLAAASYTADAAHLERMRIVEHPSRRQAAILMADLEASSALARRLSSAQYFAFVRRLVRAADHCVIDAGGIVGRHAGDGVVAFFLAEAVGSESAAATACIKAARTLGGVVADVALRSEIAESELVLRFGLHWGATLYVGGILTAGRSEVTALGDEMNEAARIEACATGGRILGSKALIERLNRADAQALGLDSGRATYTPLAELPTATDKARRDAPAIAVCDLTNLSF